MDYNYNPFTKNSNIYRSERRRLNIRCAINGILLVLFLISPFIVAFIEYAEQPEPQDPVPLPELELISHEGAILDQYEYLEECSCQISVTFNQPVSSGSALVAFYDEQNRLIESRTMTLSTDSSDRTTATGTVMVMGLVDSYEILDYDFQPYVESTEEPEYEATLIFSIIVLLVVFFVLPPTFPLWIRNFTCKCREYSVGEHRILVYAGHSHFYIKVDGIKYDEIVRFALFTTTELHTTLDDGSILDASITPTFKRIRFKVNNRLIEHTK